MHIGVLGGGLQGCCIALALAARGARVSLFDRDDALLSRTAIANEGKIHLGYLYAGDPTLKTAAWMIRGALTFAPFMARHVGLPPERFSISDPAVYVIHRDSQLGVEQVAGHFSAVQGLLREATEGRGEAYFGVDLSRPPRAWSAEEREAWFDPATTLAAFHTPEVSIDPLELAAAVDDRVRHEATIELRLGQTVLAVEERRSGFGVVSEGKAGKISERFDHVVNALWDGRLAIDATLGLRPSRRWLHRLRHRVTLRPPAGARRQPTATIIHGPFGDIVNHREGPLGLMWYPACLGGLSAEIEPPDWPMHPAEPLRARIVSQTLEALAAIVPCLGVLDLADATELSVRSGVIVAWGETDIDDPRSELHRRSEIGVKTFGRYHSVDPGKATMAPYFAEAISERIFRS